MSPEVPDSGRVQRASKALLGNATRLEIGAAIHEHRGAPFSALAIHGETGIFYSRVQEQLKALLSAGMLRQVPSQGRTIEYKAEPSIFWEMCAGLLREVRAQG